MLETAGLDSVVLDAGIAAQQLQLVNAIVDEDRQYATRLTITRTDNENVSESVISTVISWLMKKKVLSKEHCDSFRDGAYSTPDGWNGTTELEQGKTALASKRNSGVPGCVVWAMELDEQDHRLIYGRWHTRIGIIGNADSCIVNIQLSRYIVRGFIGEAAPPIPSTPRIVKMLFSDEANVVRVGSTFLNDKPIYLTSETLTSKFIPDLTDPDRTLSLILITTDEESKLPVRNLKNLTKQLFGMADIYVLDWHDRALMDTYREVFLKNTPAYDYGMECSSLKIYCRKQEIEDYILDTIRIGMKSDTVLDPETVIDFLCNISDGGFELYDPKFEIYFNSGITYGADNLELLHVTKHEIDLTVQRGGVIFQDVLKDWSIEPDATIHVWRFSESESDVMTSEFSLFMLGLLAKIKAGTIWKSSLFILSCLSDHQV